MKRLDSLAVILLVTAFLLLFVIGCDEEDIGEGAYFTIVDRTCNVDRDESEDSDLEIYVDGDQYTKFRTSNCPSVLDEGYAGKKKYDIEPGEHTIKVQYGSNGGEAETTICVEDEDNAELNVYGCDASINIECKYACGGC